MLRTRQILEARYQKSDLSKIVPEHKHLTKEEHGMLHNILNKYEFIFDRTLGTWETNPVDMELQL